MPSSAARRRTAGGRTRALRMRIGAASNRAHSGSRRGLHTVCRREVSVSGVRAEVSMKGHAAVVASGESCNSREIGNGKTGVGVEVLRFYKARKQVPGHLRQFIGARESGGRGLAVECSKGRMYVERRGGDRVHLGRRWSAPPQMIA